MQKRGVKAVAFGEITLLILATFALCFIITESESVYAEVDGSDVKAAPKSEGRSGLWTSSGTNNPIYNKAINGATGTIKASGNVFDVTKISGYEKLTDGGLKVLGENGEALGTVEKIDADSFVKVLGEKGVGFAEKEQFTFMGATVASGGWAHLLTGVTWAVAVAGAIQLIGPLLGADKTLTNALSVAAIAGIMTYKGLASLGSSGFNVLSPGNFLLQNAGLIGVGVAAVVFVLLYKKESKKTVELQCLPWEAPLGGSDCERCNQDPLKPCSEYRCKSLGQACELVNKGSSEERCTWVAKGDVNSPVITPSTNLLTVNHRYTDVQGRPPSRGTRIVRTDQTCIQPFTPLQFGVQLNEPAQCKIDIEGNKTFDEMSYYFGGSNLYRYNHSETFRLPSPDSVNAEGLEVPTEGNYNFYVRCRDANGNVNEDEFVFNLCVDKSPDTTPPIIEQTSINSGSPIQSGVQNVSLTTYVNEPAQCKWSFQDKAFDSMENAMSCSTHVYEQNAQQQYPCTTTLNGIQDRTENVFYFRCKDQPLKNDSSRNVNQESYRFTLRGSQPLAILSVSPNQTITGSTDSVRVNLTVTTDDGAEEGKALCYFSPSGREGEFIPMFSTNSFKHEQILNLGSGAYTYAFRCVDAGGNAASANVSFGVFVDRAAPRVTRAYKEGPDALKLITNEEAVCRYSPTSCNFVFDEGLPIQVLNPRDRRVHLVPWKPNEAYYVKCRDNYNNEPNPNACSIVVSATNAA